MSDFKFDPEIDPEIAADIAKRDASERDPKRSRKIPAWEPPAIVAHWQCRGGCGAQVDVPEAAMLAFETFNRQLAARREPPLDENKIIFCDACRALGRGMVAERSRRHVLMLADLMRQLKASRNPRNEHEFLRRIEAHGHPDIAGLLDALESKASKPKRKSDA